MIRVHDTIDWMSNLFYVLGSSVKFDVQPERHTRPESLARVSLSCVTDVLPVVPPQSIPLQTSLSGEGSCGEAKAWASTAGSELMQAARASRRAGITGHQKAHQPCEWINERAITAKRQGTRRRRDTTAALTM